MGEQQKTGAIIVSAGRGRRMGGVLKPLLVVGGKMLLYYSIDALRSAGVDEIVVVMVPEKVEWLKAVLLRDFPDRCLKVVSGGERRQDSVMAGLGALSSDVEIVLVHDGARPMVSCELIQRVMRGVRKYGAVVPAIPLRDTIKEVNGSKVLRTVPRDRLIAVQTPQGFLKEILVDAYRKLGGASVTDDAGVVEMTGRNVWFVEGDERNIKITTPYDLKIVEFLIERSGE